MATLIIAEAGVNHNGDLDLARGLIDAAAAAGADLVKFQTFRADQLVTLTAAKADYQAAVTSSAESQHEMLQRLELTVEMHEALIAHCAARGVEFFSTGFDRDSIDLLVKLGVRFIKVPSGELTNLPYLRHVGRHGKPVLLSTGMATLGEIECALEVLMQEGIPRNRVTVLHCNTEYPTPMTDVNLRAMLAIGNAFGVQVGYSDHTAGIEVPIAAVALGATVIEKHLTLDRALPGPDHKASLEPADFKEMVSAIRNIELALGTGIKRPSPSEIKNKLVARRSLVALCLIHTGDTFSDTNIAAKRAGSGLSPMRWDEVIGRTARRDFSPGEAIEL